MSTIGRTCPACHQPIKRKRNIEQNALYWRLLQMISEMLRPNGEVFMAESFHEYYKGRFLPHRDVRLPNGKVVTVASSTADLSVEEFSDYFEQVAEDARDRGVALPPEPNKEW